MKRYKILFLTNRNPYPVVDGQSRRTYNIIKGLSHNFDVYLLSLYEPHEKINTDHCNLTAYCSKVEFLPCPSKDISISMLARLIRSIFSKYPYTFWRHYSKRYVKRVNELLSDYDFDLLHCDCLPFAPILKNIRCVPTVLTDHDVSYLKFFRMAEMCKNILLRSFLYLESKKIKFIESNIFNYIDLVIVVSEFDKKILKNLNQCANIKVIENGVDTDQFNESSDSEEVFHHTLLWFGGFKYHPNVEAMLFFLNDIYSLISNKIKDVRLLVVGGNVTDELLEFSNNDSSIEFLGFVDDPIPYLRRASVIISPLLSGSGTRLKILEAMAVGKAIVTTSIGAEGIDGSNGQHYLIADTPLEFAKSAIAIMHDKEMEEHLGKNARMLVKEKYDWSIIWEKNSSMYMELIENNSIYLKVHSGSRHGMSTVR